MNHSVLGGVIGFSFGVLNDVDHIFPFAFGHYIVVVFLFLGFGIGLVIFKLKKEVEKCSSLRT